GRRERGRQHGEENRSSEQSRGEKGESAERSRRRRAQGEVRAHHDAEGRQEGQKVVVDLPPGEREGNEHEQGPEEKDPKKLRGLASKGEESGGQRHARTREGRHTHSH